MKQAERRLITAFLLLSMVFLSAVFAVQGSLLSTMIAQYQLTPANQGLANTMAFAGGILALVGAFTMQGRWKKRTLLKWALFMCVAGLALMYVAPDYFVYVAAWFVAGFGLGLMDTLLSACMADLYSGRQAVTMMCMLHTAYGLSSVLSPMGYAALLSAGVPWKRVYLVIGAAGLLIVAGAWAVKHVFAIRDGEALSRRPMSLKGILPALRQGRLLWLVAALFFHGIFLSGLNTWINRYAEGLGDGVTVPAQSCVFLGVMLSRMLMPFLPVKPQKYVVAGSLLGGVALCIGLTMPGGWALRVLLMVSSLCFGALIPCTITLGCERQPGNTLLVTTGIMLALYLGQALSSPLIAALEAAVGLWAGILLCAICMGLFGFCCIRDAAGKKKRAESA